MRTVQKITFVIVLMVLTSCSSTKNIGNTTRDGSSFEKAIIVNSISEEYVYVRRVCSNCQMMRQSLVMDKKKPYDILQLKKPTINSINSPV